MTPDIQDEEALVKFALVRFLVLTVLDLSAERKRHERHDEIRWFDEVEQIALAERGDDEADYVLRHIAADALESGEFLSASLSRYIAKRLRSGWDPFRRPRGRNPLVNMDRDLAIGVIVNRLKQLGLHATRNVSTKRESACSIMAKALNQAGIVISESGIARVWRFHPNDAWVDDGVWDAIESFIGSSAGGESGVISELLPEVREIYRSGGPQVINI